MPIASGAGHDALFLAQIAPMSMVFVPCLLGTSRCPEEWAEKQEIADGTNAILGAILQVDSPD